MGYLIKPIYMSEEAKTKMREQVALEISLRAGKKLREKCEGCPDFVIPTARIIVDGKRQKACRLSRHQDDCIWVRTVLGREQV